MIDAHTMRRLAALKLSPEAMSEVLEILAEASEADDLRRQKRRDQKRRERDSRATVARLSHDKDSDKGYDSRSDIPPKRKVPHTPLKKITPLRSNPRFARIRTATHALSACRPKTDANEKEPAFPMATSPTLAKPWRSVSGCRGR